MKKKIGVLLIFAVLLTCSCSKKSGTMTCTNTVESDNGTYTSNLESKITYEDGYVNTITTEEVIKTKTDSQAKDFKELLDNYYIKYNKINGYSNTVVVNNKTVTSKTTIDYKNLDIKEFVKIDEANKQLIKDGKVLLEDIKANLKQQGARCK